MRKALVIDDEASLTTIVGQFLEKAGFRVEAATSGPEGLQKAVAESPDVVLVDVMMPEMDGYEVCRRLRADPRTTRTSILVLTARGQLVDKQMARQAGADAHASKPFNGKVLVQQVEELVAARAHPETTLGCQVGVLRLKEGAGATTLATNLALCLVAEEEYLAMVADMVIPGGQVGDRLGLPPTTSWLELADTDASSLVAHIRRHDSGLFALPAPPLPWRGEVDPVVVTQLLQRLRSWHDFVVVDTPRDLGTLAPVLLKTSWLVLLLLTPDPAVLRAAQASLGVIGRFGSRGLQVWPILNVVNSDPYALQQQVEKALGLPVMAVLPWSPQECARAEANHKPVVLSYPESPLARELWILGQRVAQAMDTRMR
jgi:DNA-binding response OmpR family regulator